MGGQIRTVGPGRQAGSSFIRGDAMSWARNFRATSFRALLLFAICAVPASAQNAPPARRQGLALSLGADGMVIRLGS
jgi:hypothetical protein